MSDTAATPTWTPPAKIEDLFARQAGNQFAAINSPVAGARTQQDLPDGNAAIQLYSLGTPNGTLMCHIARSIRNVSFVDVVYARRPKGVYFVGRTRHRL